MARARLTLTDRVGVASRVLAATAGGYAFRERGRHLPGARPAVARGDAVLAMTLASFALYAAAIIWTFAARSARMAWLGLLVPILLLGTIAHRASDWVITVRCNCLLGSTWAQAWATHPRNANPT
jgi:hypothetical protein